MLSGPPGQHNLHGIQKIVNLLKKAKDFLNTGLDTFKKKKTEIYNVIPMPYLIPAIGRGGAISGITQAAGAAFGLV